MSSEMIERVARALHFSRQESDWPHEAFAGEWGELSPDARYEFEAAARDAIEAMREMLPDDIDLFRAFKGAGRVVHAKKAAAMIDAALGEGS